MSNLIISIFIFFLNVKEPNDMLQENKENPFTLFFVDKENHQKHSTDSTYIKISLDSKQYFFVEKNTITSPIVKISRIRKNALDLKFKSSYGVKEITQKYYGKNMVLLFNQEKIIDYPVTITLYDTALATGIPSELYQKIEKALRKEKNE